MLAETRTRRSSLASERGGWFVFSDLLRPRVTRRERAVLRWFPRACALLVVASLSGLGCGPMGARTIPEARFDYNDAIIRSFDSQMLLNLVRLRYQDSILFLDLSSVVASYNRSVNGGVSPSGTIKPGSYAWGANAGGAWSETPTISYSPLQGEDLPSACSLRFPRARSFCCRAAVGGWNGSSCVSCNS